MNLSTKQKLTHRHGEQTCGCQGGGGRERDGLGVWGWQMQTITFRTDRDFPGGAVAKNLPANAGDTHSILGPTRESPCTAMKTQRSQK